LAGADLRTTRAPGASGIADRIGHLPIAKVTREDVEAVRGALDEAIALHKRTDARKVSAPSAPETCGPS
jgi:hypothetical protein